MQIGERNYFKESYIYYYDIKKIHLTQLGDLACRFCVIKQEDSLDVIIDMKTKNLLRSDNSLRE